MSLLVMSAFFLRFSNNTTFLLRETVTPVTTDCDRSHVFITSEKDHQRPLVKHFPVSSPRGRGEARKAQEHGSHGFPTKRLQTPVC